MWKARGSGRFTERTIRGHDRLVPMNQTVTI